MPEFPPQHCPRCNKTLEAGFAHRAGGLSFVEPEKLEHFMFMDEDLSEAGLSRFLPAPAAFFRSYLCRSCELYLIDYSETLTRAKAEELAKSIIDPG
jgi:hypothetical protein